MKEIFIKKDDSGLRLDKFIIKVFPSIPVSMVYRGIRLKRIKINGKRAAAETFLKTGDSVALYINDEFLAEKPDNQAYLHSKKSINVVYEDANIIIVNKEKGLICHSEDNTDADTLINRVLKYLVDKGEYEPSESLSFRPALCNRIDRNTAGLVIAAKTAESLRTVNALLKENKITKKYLCAAFGYFEEKSETKTAYLYKNADRNRVYIEDKKTKQNKTIITKYKVLEEKNGISLLDVELITGRTHQIRAHLAYLGHPLLGDGKYGSESDNRKMGIKTQALLSYKIKFSDKLPPPLEHLAGKSFETDTGEFYKLFERISG